MFQCDTAGIGSSSPVGVAFNSSNGFYAIADSSADEIFVVDSTCAIQHQFDTAGDGMTTPVGITYRPDTDQYEVVGSSLDDFSSMTRRWARPWAILTIALTSAPTPLLRRMALHITPMTAYQRYRTPVGTRSSPLAIGVPWSTHLILHLLGTPALPT